MTQLTDITCAQRRRAFDGVLGEAGVGVVWLPIGADLKYLTGIERRVPTFGEVNYTHGWVAGAFLAVSRYPLFILPRNYIEFDPPHGVPGEVISVSELDDGDVIFDRAASAQPTSAQLAIGARTWGSATIRLMQAFPDAQLANGTSLLNRLRRTKSNDELVLIREACRIVDEAMRKTSSRVDIGVTEMDPAEEVNHHLLREEARTWSFDTAVWSMGRHADRDATVRVSTVP